MTALPKVQQAQYGDSAKLEQLGAKRITDNPAASVQTVKDMAGGRPPETDPVKLATRAVTRSGGRQAATPEEDQYQSRFDEFAYLTREITKWTRLAASPGAGRLTRAYGRAAVNAYKARLLKLRAETPFFND